MDLDPLDPALIKEGSELFKILYLSNAPYVPSGYGVQCGGNCWNWIKYYDVRVLANYGLEGAMLELNELAIYPVLSQDDHATRTANMIFPVYKPDLFITLYDIWMGAFVNQNPQSPTGYTPIHPWWIPIVMVDHDPIPENTLLSAQEAYKIVTPTRFGVREFERRGVGHKTYYIPFGFETDVFKPTVDKTADVQYVYNKSRAFNDNNKLPWDREEIFLITANGANKDPYRKAWPRQFLALQLFIQQNPDAARDTRFYAHSWAILSRDLPHIAKTLMVEEFVRGPADYHMFQSVPKEGMARMYQASDLFLHLSQGGGFEIPIMEAMCCGIPVVVNDFVGMRELAEGHGWLVPPIEHREKGVDPADPEKDVVVDRSRYFTPLDATVQIADAWEAMKCIEDAYNNPDQGKRYGQVGREFSLDFDWSIINPMWYRLFEDIREERAYKPLESRRL